MFWFLSLRTVFFLALSVGFAACTQLTEDLQSDLRTLPSRVQQSAAVVPRNPLIAGSSARQTAVRSGPAPPSAPEGSIPPEPSIRLSGDPVNVTIEQMPLLTFINTIFGDTP